MVARFVQRHGASPPFGTFSSNISFISFAVYSTESVFSCEISGEAKKYASPPVGGVRTVERDD
jgi:hypothetical protein